MTTPVEDEVRERCADAAEGEAWTLSGPDGLSIRVLALGASWVGCRVPLRDGSVREALLGFDDLDSQRRNRAYIGATIGRWANRIAGLRLRRDGREWPLSSEPGLNHQLHGGPGGFHRREWSLLERTDRSLRLGLHSADGDQGFPGALDAQVSYRLLDDLTVEIELQATLIGDQSCPVGMTNHAYFQLDGDGDADVRGQRLRVAAASMLPVDGHGLPIDAPAAVADTRFDFRETRVIGEVLDHAFLLDGAGEGGSLESLRLAAKLKSADGLLAMDLSTTLPALQIYTGEFLGEGTVGCAPRWPAFSGIALEPQYLPDSPHHPEWPQPDCWLAPGRMWRHRMMYRFRT